MVKLTSVLFENLQKAATMKSDSTTNGQNCVYVNFSQGLQTTSKCHKQ